MPKGGWLHFAAIGFGLVGAIFVVFAIALQYGFVTVVGLDGITEIQSEFYAGLAIVGAIFSEVASREL